MTRKIPDEQDRAEDPGRSGAWWLAAILVLIFSIGVAALIFATQHDGLVAAVLAFYGSFLAAFVCVACATVSFARRERRRRWALFPAVPSAALLIWGLSTLTRSQYHAWQSSREFKVYRASIERLKADPEIAFREHWPATRTTSQSRAFFDAVWAPYVEFSASQVERIYADLPPFREVVFKQAACTPDFISAHFPEALDRARNNSPAMLENIVHHPHTPLALIQCVVFHRKQLPFEPPYQAGLVLQIRKADVPADPRERLQASTRDADGKFFVLTLLGLNSRLPDAGGKNRIPDQVNSYVPGVPPDFDPLKRGEDEFVFLPGLYNEYHAKETEQLRLAEAFAREHNERVFRQSVGPRKNP